MSELEDLRKDNALMRMRLKIIEAENTHLYKLVALQSRMNDELLSFTRLNEGVSSRQTPSVRQDIDHFFNKARECVEYVATANYAGRENEAKKSLREEYDRIVSKL
jgi:hypothetical protein